MRRVLLVFRRLLDAVDDDNFDGAFLRIQLQPKLFLECGKDRRTCRIGQIGREDQPEVVLVGEAGSIHDRARNLTRKKARQIASIGTSFPANTGPGFLIRTASMLIPISLLAIIGCEICIFRPLFATVKA